MSDDLLDLDLSAAPRPSEIPDVRLLGRPTVNAQPVRSTKPLELVAAVALAGGRYSRDGLVSGIYGGEASDSAIPALADRSVRHTGPASSPPPDLRSGTVMEM
ncbi:hypothetical protein ACLBWP_04835 [Microbacterium sp. M1A1_1b]